MSDSLDLDALIIRFQNRAKSVKDRPFPPVEGPERARIKELAQQDFMDYSLIGDSTVSFEDGQLVFRVKL